MEKLDIAVIDYGMGNLRSVDKALEYVSPSATVKVTADPDEILSAERVVFPGPGARRATACARSMRAACAKSSSRPPRASPSSASAWVCRCCSSTARRATRPALASSKGEVIRFPREAMHDDQGEKLKVPHMGWNNVHQAMGHPLWAGIEDGSRFYYVHSYFVQPATPENVAGFSHYPFPFTSAVASGNIFAVQFHPEKSAQAGLTLLGNFITWDPFNARQSACDMAGSTCA